MSHDDVLFGYRLQLFDLAGRIGVSAACRGFGIHRSTYYRLKPQVERHGLEVLRLRERRRPRMPNQLSPLVEERIVAFALGHPALGPRRIAAELARPRWGGLVVSHNGVWRCLCRHGVSTRRNRLSLVAGYRAPYEPPREPAPERHVEAKRPGELVGIDCFFVGRLHGTNGTVWQLTAIDVASSFASAELVRCPSGQPGTAQTSRLARRVAPDLSGEVGGSSACSSTTAASFAAPSPRRSPRSAPTKHASTPDGRRQTGRSRRSTSDPRRVLATGLRPLPLSTLPGPQARARALPRVLQLRPGPHRPAHPRANPR
jgi:transposase